jgi:photosystem II stability/assembly factor-like uncharacterized protein
MKRNFGKLIILLAILILITACSVPPSDTKEKAYDIAPVAEEAESLPLSTPTEIPRTEIPPTAPPEPVFERISLPTLTKLDMIDPLNGWGQAEGKIVRTEDGGETWLDVTPSDLSSDPAYAQSYFLDVDNAWVLIENSENPDIAVLYRTIDGGENWIWRNTPFGRSVIGFMDNQTGYALNDLGAGAGSMGVAIWQTSDSGDNFNRVFQHEPGYDASLPFSGIKNGIHFIDAQNGWVTGSQPQDGFVWFYRTRDGGFSWEHQVLEMPTAYETAQTSAYAPQFFENGQGLLPVYLHGEKSAMVFYRTVDGGEIWDAIQVLAARGKYAIASVNEILVWDGGETLYFSLDSGESWQSRITTWQPLDTLRSLDFVSITEGWALTDEDLYRTEDGGVNWEKLGS